MSSSSSPPPSRWPTHSDAAGLRTTSSASLASRSSSVGSSSTSPVPFPRPPRTSYGAVTTPSRFRQLNGAGSSERSKVNPWQTLSIRTTFLAGSLLLLIAVLMFLTLLISLFTPLPTLLPTQRSPSLVSMWMLLISILLLAPGLLLFELSSKAVRKVHYASLTLLAVCVILLLAITNLRSNEAWTALPAVLLAAASIGWAVVTSHVIDNIILTFQIAPPRIEDEPALAVSAEQAVQSDETQPLLFARMPIKRVQRKWTRYLKIFVAWLGTAAVSTVLGLLILDLVITGTDAGLHPPGKLVTIRPVDLSASAQAEFAASESAVAVRRGRDPASFIPSFKLHIACEGEVRESPPIGNLTRPRKPIALVFTERGVAGEVGAQWVRDLVRRSQEASAKDDDGHLSLERVCFWDRFGYGHTDYLATTHRLRFHSLALHAALVAIGEVTTPEAQVMILSGKDPKPQPPPKEFPGTFLVISTGHGSLFARHFAATYPDLVHAQMLIDAEGPDTWWGDVVSASSRLRAGAGARWHGSLGLIWADALPALLAPLGITRIMGMLAGKGPQDRILAPRGHGGARSSRRDPGGGGWRLRAGGANERLLATSLAERMDANRGTESSNYRAFQHPAFNKTLDEVLATRPTAVLSSFWKVHRDFPGWGTYQRDYFVRPAKDRKGLVGWWRLGVKENPARGGDDGGAEGACDTALGKVWCEEAVRKLLAADLVREASDKELDLDLLTYNV